MTLGHNTITSYPDFTQRLIERKDPEVHFRELAQLKQIGSADAFISDFHRITIMVTDISESRLITFFIEALTEPLQGWVKSYRPTTLAYSIRWTRDLQDVVPKNRFPPRTNFPIKDKERKPFQKEWPKKEWIDNDT